MNRYLYCLPVPEDAQIDTGTSLSRQLAAQGAVGSDESSVEAVSLDPNEQKIQGSYRTNEQLGGVLARQFEQLFSAGGIEYVPYFGADGQDGVDGYYTLSDVDVGPADASTEAVQTYDGTVTKVGTRKDYVRAVRTSPSTVDTVGASNYTEGDPPTHPEQVCLPVSARRPRWFDPLSGALEQAAPLNRWQYPERDGELADFRTYGLSDASFYNPTAASPSAPTLIYDVPYRYERQMDVRVWDTCPDALGEEKVVEGNLARGTTVGGPGATVGEATVGESAREHNVDLATTWQRVFRAGHEARGELVIDNGVLRLRFDDERGSLRAERSRGHFDEWAAQPLRPSSWALRDVDITHIGLARVDAQVVFQHPDKGQYVVDLALPRGYENAIWTVAQNQTGAADYELAQKLAPVAQFGGVSVRVPNQRAGLVAREELRR